MTVEDDTVRAVRGRQATVKEAAPPDVDRRSSAAQAAPSGAFQFSMTVTMADIAALPPEKISAFMSAIAELMKIKATLGQNGGEQ